jgi:hypothetical protein
LAELSRISIVKFPWTVQDTLASILLIPPVHFRIWNGQSGHGKPGLGLSSVHNGHAFLDEWSATGSYPASTAGFLRKQLAFYEERQVQPKRLNDSARFSLILWSRLCNWKEALVIVKPETLIGWHRKGFQLFGNGSRSLVPI